MASIYQQALIEVRDRIIALNLECVGNKEVVIRKDFQDDERIHTGITVSWDREREMDSVAQRDDYAYPCVITMVEGTESLEEEIDLITLWRQKIRREFNNQRLLTVSEDNVNHIVCTVQHADIDASQTRKSKSYNVGRLVVRCWFREPRGN